MRFSSRAPVDLTRAAHEALPSEGPQDSVGAADAVSPDGSDPVGGVGLFERLQAALSRRYTLRHEIGRGGTAVVFLARDQRHERDVAIKVLKPGLTDVVGPERFLREIRIAAPLQHPHVLPIHDSGRAAGLLYYVMPYVAGESLRDRLDREQQLPVDEALRFAAEVADALSCAHGRGVVHRDIKPENILLSNGHAVVADFGFATAVEAATGDDLTASGIAVGTPAYMSPEQASGSDRLDGRSDVYSLGCVLYEMLGGEPPFDGRSARAILAKHVSERVPRLGIIRPDLPTALERAVERMLAKSPTDRVPVSEVASVLTAATSQPDTPVRRAPRFAVFALGITVFLALGVIGIARSSETTLGADRYVIAPCPVSPPGLDATACADLVAGALARFEGVTVENALAVRDRMGRTRIADGVDLSDWFAAARSLGAGRLVVPVPELRSGAVALRADVYDVAERTLHHSAPAVPVEMSTPTVGLTRLATAILELPRSPDGTPLVTDIRAGRAYAAAMGALAPAWDLGRARLELDRAIDADSAFGAAFLWRAWLSAWEGRAPDTWRADARRALRYARDVGDRQWRLADALMAMANTDYQTACDRYAEVVRDDPDDVRGWAGLAQCHAADGVVTRDATSPSGWRFRTSYHTATDALRRALELEPSFVRVLELRDFRLLGRLLALSPGKLRGGIAAPPDTGRFLAYPSFAGDTLGYVPYPYGDVLGGAPETIPATETAAIAHGQRTFASLVQQWPTAQPTSSSAHRVYGLALEYLGQLDERLYGDRSAMAAITTARRLARTRSERFTAAVSELRLLVKLARFREAHTAADSLLARWPEPNLSEMDQVAAVAALLGRAHLAARHVARSVGEVQRVHPDPLVQQLPLPALSTALRFEVYAAVGGPLDSLQQLAGSASRLLQSWLRRNPSPELVHTLLDLPAQLAYPQLGPTVHRAPAAGDRDLIEVQWLLSSGNADSVRLRLRDLARRRARQRPGDVATWRLYHESWLVTQVGDSTDALDRLGAVLHVEALPTLGTDLLDRPLETASLVRSMALAARLAAALDDHDRARDWAAWVTALWVGADVELQPLVDEMRRLAASPQRED